jgi:hypothetical protein
MAHNTYLVFIVVILFVTERRRQGLLRSFSQRAGLATVTYDRGAREADPVLTTYKTGKANFKSEVRLIDKSRLLVLL